MLFKYIEPKTETASTFVDRYGGLFFIDGVWNSPHPSVRMTGHGGGIVVESRDDGIYVDGTKFCTNW